MICRDDVDHVVIDGLQQRLPVRCILDRWIALDGGPERGVVLRIEEEVMDARLDCDLLLLDRSSLEQDQLVRGREMQDMQLRAVPLGQADRVARRLQAGLT